MLGMKKGVFPGCLQAKRFVLASLRWAQDCFWAFSFRKVFFDCIATFAINLEKFRIVFSAGALRQTVLCFAIIFLSLCFSIFGLSPMLN